MPMPALDPTVIKNEQKFETLLFLEIFFQVQMFLYICSTRPVKLNTKRGALKKLWMEKLTGKLDQKCPTFSKTDLEHPFRLPKK
jgi:hypothetical protein